ELAACVLCLAVASDARALGHSPGVWEKAANPILDSNDETHREVQGLLMQMMPTPGDYWESGQGREQLRTALEKLDEARADTAPDVRLRFDLGEVAHNLRDYARCSRALQSALAEAPDDPQATHAYFMLGICHAKLQQPEKEVTCYDEFLRRETNTLGRAQALSNRAEAQMLMHRLPPAIADYRASLALQPDMALTHFGLAVALDRGGDAPGAMVEAKAAATYDPLDQDLTRADVFFMPPYDLSFYEALNAMARAQMVDDPAASVLWWETAVAKWMEYVALAASSDPWIALAKAHQSSCERQLTAAKKKLARPLKTKKKG
ncbi:MAG TPA: tetratricopeptide repeat protein, partial [Usitatibacter sp.]